jgi:serine/threonine protein kinase
MLRSIPHPNIVQIYEMFEDNANYYIITELCDGGDLFSRIEKLGYFTEKDAAYFLEEILMAINHCHSKKICHRDLKPENVLID